MPRRTPGVVLTHDYRNCRVCGHQYVRDFSIPSQPCTRCDEIEKKLGPDVIEWIQDIIRTQIGDHELCYYHNTKPEY